MSHRGGSLRGMRPASTVPVRPVMAVRSVMREQTASPQNLHTHAFPARIIIASVPTPTLSLAFAPLFVTLGAAADELVTQRTVIDGFWHGMARRSVQFG